MYFSFLSFQLHYPLVHQSCDHLFMTYIVFMFIYICDNVCCFSPISPYVFFFSLFIHMFLYVCNLLFLFHTRCLDEFCLTVSERHVVKVYHAMNSLLAKFFKSLY